MVKLWKEIELLLNESKLSGFEKKSATECVFTGEMGVSYDKLEISMEATLDELFLNLQEDVRYKFNLFSDNEFQILDFTDSPISIPYNLLTNMNVNICLNPDVIDGQFRVNQMVYDLVQDDEDKTIIDENLVSKWREILESNKGIIVLNKAEKKRYHLRLDESGQFSLEPIAGKKKR